MPRRWHLPRQDEQSRKVFCQLSRQAAQGRVPGNRAHARTLQPRRTGARSSSSKAIQGAGHAWSGGSPAAKGRRNESRAQIEETTSDYDRKKLQERLAKLAGGVAVDPRRAGSTKVEVKERKERV